MSATRKNYNIWNPSPQGSNETLDKVDLSEGALVSVSSKISTPSETDERVQPYQTQLSEEAFNCIIN